MYLCSQHADKPPYLPGLERWSAYKTIWLRHWPGFRAAYNAGFRNPYGPLTAEKLAEVEKLLRCGKFGNGYGPEYRAWVCLFFIGEKEAQKAAAQRRGGSPSHGGEPSLS